MNKENINEEESKNKEILDAKLIEAMNLRSIYETKLKEVQCMKEKLDNWETKVSYSRPFNKLPARVEHEILKKLDFKDYLNLALTCRKWYNTAESAPSSVKPSLQFQRFISVRPPGIFLENPYYVRHILSCALIDRIKCEELRLVGKSQPIFLRFISEIKSHFDCEDLCIEVPTSCEENASLLYSIADMSSKLTFTRYDYVKDENTENCTFNERIIFERHVSHSKCHILRSIDSTIPNMILKQWIKGERPNLQVATVSFTDSIELVLDDVIEGLDEFVVDKQVDPEAEQHTTTIVVDGLPNIYVYYRRNRVKLGREGIENIYY